MKQIDENDCDWHVYANRENFVLNIYCGDLLTLTWRNTNGHPKADTASYDKDPPEESILIRVGNKLVNGNSKPD